MIDMLQNKKLRDRSKKFADLDMLKSYMILNNIDPTIKKPFNPEDAKNINEEKSKILNMECAKLELLQCQYQKQRNIMMKIKIDTLKNNNVLFH